MALIDHIQVEGLCPATAFLSSAESFATPLLRESLQGFYRINEEIRVQGEGVTQMLLFWLL